jgi:N-acetylglucosaminyldiphosphoundecaprenol N-acetyl-beta-D-mannosaminyltransferase
MNQDRRQIRVIRSPIDVVGWERALTKLSQWAQGRESRVVCIANVHMVVTALHDPILSDVLEHADLTTPDGVPVAWMQRRLGAPEQPRISGPDLMWAYFEQAQSRNESIFLYGGTEKTLQLLQARIRQVFPRLKIAGAYSPPFRLLTEEEDAAVVGMINSSGAGTVWVSLGCPKQEKWIAAHRGRVHAVMIGVGAAFNYHAGTLKRAPLWMQRNGLEWFYRLLMEPRYLWKRYLVTNSLFIVLAGKQLLWVKVRNNA